MRGLVGGRRGRTVVLLLLRELGPGDTLLVPGFVHLGFEDDLENFKDLVKAVLNLTDSIRR